MSQFTTVSTEIRDEFGLRETITSLGYKISDVKELRGYGGITQACDFQIEVQKGYNIGFKKIDGNYTIVSDKFLNPSYNTIVPAVLQGYAHRIIQRNAQAMGYTQIKRTVDENNTIKLVYVKR